MLSNVKHNTLAQASKHSHHRKATSKPHLAEPNTFLYPTTSLLVFFKYFAGIGRSSSQVTFIGRLPSWLT